MCWLVAFYLALWTANDGDHSPNISLHTANANRQNKDG